MWAFHDKIRDNFRALRKCLESKEFTTVDALVYSITDDLQGLMHIEEVRLFPNALDLLSEDDWKEMREGDLEIG
jgi:DUF438 domain-containing protein